MTSAVTSVFISTLVLMVVDFDGDYFYFFICSRRILASYDADISLLFCCSRIAKGFELTMAAGTCFGNSGAMGLFCTSVFGETLAGIISTGLSYY